MTDRRPTSDQPERKRVLWGVFVAALSLSLAGGLLVHPHASFGVEDKFGFYALLGALSGALLIVFSMLLGALLKRPDTYYDD